MPTATSFAELENQFKSRMKSAMQVTQSKILNVMYEEVGSFYTRGNPTLYVRTGNLANSPRVSGISGGGNQLSFEAYLDPGWYLVPNPAFTDRGFASKFTPSEVLGAAEVGQAHILGKGGFWSRSLKRMKQELISTFSLYFH